MEHHTQKTESGHQAENKLDFEHSRHKKPKKNNIASTIAVLAIAPIVALLLINFGFQSYEVSGPSMETTLQNADKLIGLKAPITLAKLRGKSYIPKRNEVIIFEKNDIFPGDASSTFLIKRVVGLPGDRVVVSNGILKIYNTEHPEGFEPDRTFDYGKVITTTPGDIDVTVPAGSIFVDGDNRPNSKDSRSFGPIKAETVVAIAKFRFAPVSKAKKL